MSWMKSIRGGQLKVLGKSQIKDIHYASLDILEHTGVNVLSERALKILDDAGADVNYETQVVRIPPNLTEHTRKHFRSHFYPDVFNKDLFEGWKKRGSKDVRQVARERAQQILKEHEPEPLDKDIEKDVLEIIKEIERRDLKT